MLSSPRSMKSRTSSIRMSPSCLRLAPATRSMTSSLRSLSSMFDLRKVDGTAHPGRPGDHLAAVVLPGLQPPERELADHAAQGVGDHLGMVGVGDPPATHASAHEVEQPARELHVEVLEGGIRLQRLAEEHPVEGGLLLDKLEEGVQRLVEWLRAAGGLLDAALEPARRSVHHRLEELALAIEVLVEQRFRDARRAG